MQFEHQANVLLPPNAGTHIEKPMNFCLELELYWTGNLLLNAIMAGSSDGGGELCLLSRIT